MMFQKLWPRSKNSNRYKSNIPVIVNVYDMLPSHWLVSAGDTMGIGVYHSGVEILGREYCYGGHDKEDTGVFTVVPRSGPQGVMFKMAIPMGNATMKEEEVKTMLKVIADEFRGNQYSLLTRNCNHFTAELVFRLTGRSPPSWINRAARLGTMFPCVLPPEWISPPEFEGDEDHVQQRRPQSMHQQQPPRLQKQPPRPASMVITSAP